MRVVAAAPHASGYRAARQSIAGWLDSIPKSRDARFRSQKSMMKGQTVSPHSCVVCGSEVAPRLDSALYHCRECGYWGSDFAPAPAEASRSALNETHRRAALAGLRNANSRTILRVLGRHAPLAGARLCDIGCAYGWFLKTAQDCGV